mgnify:CR=1 FL=1
MKIFRKIRGVMVQQNRVLKYCLYAVGEIILVVIGILIALQVNNWNIERKNAAQEQRTLFQLKKEYTANLSEIQSKIELRETIISSIYTLLSYPAKGLEKPHLAVVHLNWARTYINPTYDGAAGVTEGLFNSGRLYLIKNEELRGHLSNFSGEVSKVTEEEQYVVRHILPRYVHYFVFNYDKAQMTFLPENYDFLPSEVMLERATNLEQVKNRIISGEEAYDFSHKGKLIATMDSNEYSRLLSDTVILNFLREILVMHKTANAQSFGLKKKIVTILELLDQELAGSCDDSDDIGCD